jgi:hypothetical protein
MRLSLEIAHFYHLLQRGLHYIGMVKTNHREYPKGYLTAWSEMANVRRGDHKTLKTRFIINGKQNQYLHVPGKTKK